MSQPESSLAMSLECSICTNHMKNAVALVPCMHHYCEECITNCLRTNTNCPLCRQLVMGQHRSPLIDEIISAAPASAPDQTFEHIAVVLEAAESTEIQLALEESHRATRNQAAEEMERLRREEERDKYELIEMERRSSEHAAYEREEAERRRRQREEWDALEPLSSMTVAKPSTAAAAAAINVQGTLMELQIQHNECTPKELAVVRRAIKDAPAYGGGEQKTSVSAKQIKTTIDKHLGPSWQVIVGRSFGASVGFEKAKLAFATVPSGYYVLVFKNDY